MFNMKKTAIYYDKTKGNLASKVIKFMANEEYGFYYNEELKLVCLSKFAKGVRHIEIVNVLGRPIEQKNKEIGDFGDDFFKVEYTDGSIKIIDYNYDSYESKLNFCEVKV